MPALYPTTPILSAVNCNGCFYLLHKDGCLSKVDTTSPPPIRMEKLSVASLADQFGAFSMKNNAFLLESDGEVLFVSQLLAFMETDIVFEVHKLDV